MQFTLLWTTQYPYGVCYFPQGLTLEFWGIWFHLMKPPNYTTTKAGSRSPAKNFSRSWLGRI